jgi:hypothetical protein
MSNRKVISMMAARDEAAVEDRRREFAAIELEWLRAIREFRGKLEQLEARMQRFEDGWTPPPNA